MPRVFSILREALRSVKLGRDLRSKLRLATDVLVSRLLRVIKPTSFNATRQVLLASGTNLHYRLNRGDVQGIREVWLDECYTLPQGAHPKILIDLGGNIGLTSLWMHARFRCTQIIAVEPDEANAMIIAQNFVSNTIPGKVIRAAIGPRDGEVSFACADTSNAGHVVKDGEKGKTIRVPMVSMDTVLRDVPEGSRVDVVKLDIEGGEALLFEGDLNWLKRVDLIVAELHPELVDCDRIGKLLRDAGFRFIPTGTLSPHSLSVFIRTGHPAASSLPVV